MILVDTNVIIDLWKNSNSRYAQIFDTEEVCIC